MALGRRRGAGVLALLAAVTILLLAPAFFVPGASDLGVYFNAGRLLDGGATLYADFWDHKTPGIHLYMAGWESIFGSGWYSAMSSLVPLYLLVGWLTYVMARRFLPTRGYALAAALGCVVLVLQPPATDPENGSIIVLASVFELGSMIVLLRTADRSGGRGWPGYLAAGLLLGLALMTRQTAVAPIVVAAWLLIRHFRAPREDATLGPSGAGLVALGAAAVIAGILAWLLARGVSTDTLRAQLVDYNRYYTADFLPREGTWSRTPAGLTRDAFQQVMPSARFAVAWVLALVAIGTSLPVVRRIGVFALLVAVALVAAVAELLHGTGPKLGALQLALALAAAVAVARAWPLVTRPSIQRNPLESEACGYLVAVALVVLVATGLGRFYSFQIAPLLAIVAAIGAERVIQAWRSTSVPSLVKAAGVVPAVAIPLAYTLQSDARTEWTQVRTMRDLHFRTADMADQQLARTIKPLLGPGGTMFVFGYRDWLYTLTGAHSPVRHYSAHMFESTVKPREFDGYLSAFERRPPRVIVVADRPPTPRSREWRPSYVLRFERSVLSRYRPYRSVASTTKGRRWIVMTQARG